MNNIDESFTKQVCIALFCPICSLGQTYREFAAVGVWPGTNLPACCAPTVPLRYQLKLLETTGGQVWPVLK